MCMEPNSPLVACILMHDKITHKRYLTFRAFMISCVARTNPTRNVIYPVFGHPRFRTSRASCCTTKPRTEPHLTFQAFTISCVACNLLHEQITHGTLFHPFSGIHDFFRSVQLVARPNHARNVISPIFGHSRFLS